MTLLTKKKEVTCYLRFKTVILAYEKICFLTTYTTKTILVLVAFDVMLIVRLSHISDCVGVSASAVVEICVFNLNTAVTKVSEIYLILSILPTLKH